MKRRDYLKACITTLGGLLFAPGSFAQFQEVETPEGTIRRQLRFTVSLTNPTNQELLDQVLWMYLPAGETSTQKLDTLKVSMPHELLTDTLGHRILKLSFPHVAPLAGIMVSIVANVLVQHAPHSEPLANPKAWLGAERYVEIGDSRIQALAAELTRPTECETARAIYDWIRQHLQYAGYTADDRGAVDALNHRRGDCTEYAYLSVALARTAGIPARMVGGYVIDRNSVLRGEDYHNWAEVYLEGAWRLLDAQKECWLTSTEQYVAFRFYRDEAINPIGLAHRFRLQGALRVGF